MIEFIHFDKIFVFSPSLADLVVWFILVVVLLKYFRRFENILLEAMIWNMSILYLYVIIWI